MSSVCIQNKVTIIMIVPNVPQALIDPNIPIGMTLPALCTSSDWWITLSKAPIVQIAGSQAAEIWVQPIGQSDKFSNSPKT